jgi:tRNA dimethylallyltransferase
LVIDNLNKPLLVIVGPTAVGKTALSLRLAADFNLEILSADSRQIYRGLDIGTAKATPQEQAAAPHHFIDIIDPDDILTLAQFQKQAYAVIDACHQRQTLPVLVGGTGQWVQAVVEGWGIPRVPPDYALRAKLEAQAQQKGAQAFHAQLTAVDPQAAQKIDPRNVRRVIRALEVYHKTGVPISEHQRKSPPPYRILQLGLTMPRELLYERIDRRIDKMMETGLLNEVQQLVEKEYTWNSPAMSGLGYRQIGQYLRGEMSLDEAVALIKKETRRFVRQQYNWFREDDEKIVWFDISAGLQLKYADIRAVVQSALKLTA